MIEIFMIAGEASGDVLGARLMHALHARHDDIMFSGIGGARMTEAGLTSQFPMQELAVMGLAEILPRILSLQRRIRQTIAEILRRRPDMVVTIDSPGFCLRVLQGIQASGLKRVHYVAPQVWAWRQSRARRYPGLWDRLLCLLPFEKEFFAPYGVNPVFVGHPVLESGADKGDAAKFLATYRILPNATPVVLMPGSRVTETSRLMPIFRETMARLQPEFPALVPILAAASGSDVAIAQQAADWNVEPLIIRDVAERYDAFAAAHAALTKSGTSTLELAMAGVPMAVTYRVNPVSAAIGRRLIKVPHVAMVNLLAGNELVPELLQQDCTPDKLAATLRGLMNDMSQARLQKAGYAEALHGLRAPAGMPSGAAAEAILALL